MYLLDTDTLSHLHAGRAQVQDRLRDTEEQVAITIVTRVELLRGRMDFLLKAATGEELLRAQKWMLKTEDLLAELVTIPFDARAAAEFDHLQSSSKLRRIGRADLLTASIALAHGAVLVTRNLRHFRQIPRLGAVNWVD